MFMVNKYLCLSEKGILKIAMRRRGLLPAACIIGLLYIISLYSGYLEKSFLLERQRVLYTPPARAVELLSANFASFSADIFYIRGILALSDEFNDLLQRTRWIQDNFSVAIFCDPKLVQGYFFAGVVVGQDKERIKLGIEFLEKHMHLNTQEWRIPYWIGFNYYQLGDYLKAIDYYKSAALFPGSPDFLKSNPAIFYYRAGKADMGVLYLEGLLKTLKDPRQAEWIKVKLEWLSQIAFLEEKVGEFKDRFSRLPDDLEELVEKDIILKIPADPFGRGYYLDKDSGRVKSRFGGQN